MPEYNGHEELNLNDAEMMLTCAGEEARAAVHGREDAVGVLAATPYLGPQTADAHQTIAAVAGLLGDSARLVADHHCQDPAELEKNYACGFGCGCYIELKDSDGSEWQFQRGDSSWNLWRTTDIDEDGILREWTELGIPDAYAHPGHVSARARAASVTCRITVVAWTPRPERSLPTPSGVSGLYMPIRAAVLAISQRSPWTSNHGRRESCSRQPPT